MQKTPSVAYFTRRLQTAGREEIYEVIEDAPLKTKDYAFLADIVEGLSNQALAQKYHKSPSRISQWKRSVFEQMHQYELHHEQWLYNRS